MSLKEVSFPTEFSLYPGEIKLFINPPSDGRKEEVHFDKITSRIQKLCYGLNMDFVDPVCPARTSQF